MHDLTDVSPVRLGGLTAAWFAANLTILLAIALTLADEVDEATSTTPAGDGALRAVLAAGALAVVNGAMLCVSERTRPVGIGILVGVLAAIPVGSLVFVVFLSRGVGVS